MSLCSFHSPLTPMANKREFAAVSQTALVKRAKSDDGDDTASSRAIVRASEGSIIATVRRSCPGAERFFSWASRLVSFVSAVCDPHARSGLTATV